MGKGALRPFFKGHSLKKEKEHEKKEVDKMLSHFVTLPFLYPIYVYGTIQTGKENEVIPCRYMKKNN